MCEHFFIVRRVRQLAGQVLPWEVQILVHVQPPLWAIGHIVDDAVASDELPRTALAILAAQFEVRDEALGEIHQAIIKGIQSARASR